MQLEWRYSKREVMAIYLTLAPMGGNLEGARAASLAYFGKEPKQLSAAEAALLVAIPQSPTRRRPERSPAAAQAGRDRVLARGLEDGVIDRALWRHGDRAGRSRAQRSGDADERAASRGLARRPVARRGRADHDPLPAPGRPCSQLVSRGARPDGLTRRTSRWSWWTTAPAASSAWLGGSAIFGRAGQVDLVRAHRSPGSALKPMIYAMAFDDRTLHPESLVEDVPVRFQDWLPRNLDRDHQGAVTVRRALQQSLNVPAVLALEKVGPAALPLDPAHRRRAARPAAGRSRQRRLA